MLCMMKTIHTPTRIIYGANLNTRVGNECLEYLIEHGLIERVVSVTGKRTRYNLLPKGRGCADTYLEILYTLGVKVDSETWW